VNQKYSTQHIATILQEMDAPYQEFLTRAIIGLIVGRRASIHSISKLMPDKSTRKEVKSREEANRQEIRRFLEQPEMTREKWAKLIVSFLPESAWTIAMDRTNWKVGNSIINILYLAIIYKGVAIPIFWVLLDKEGNSDTEERIALWSRFTACFPDKKLNFLTADREFIGHDWIKWLQEQGIPFRIRVKAGEYFTSEKGERKKASKWFHYSSCKCKNKPMNLWGLSVFVGGKRLEGDKFLIVISNTLSDVLSDYSLRWKIECLFQSLKGRGFDLEIGHLTDQSRLKSFLGILALAVCCCFKVGLWLDETKPLKLKKHGRRALSVLRRGLDLLQMLLAPLSGKRDSTLFFEAIGTWKATQ
jgi:hypothetical protein